MHGAMNARHGFVTLVRRTILATLALSMLVAASGAATAAPDQGAKVYLLRGFMNVFSLGLDELAAKIEQRGIRVNPPEVIQPEGKVIVPRIVLDKTQLRPAHRPVVPLALF